ncbi:hypothetical protein N7528_007504 [Penicillium herquei]|uniref:Hydrophobin n=1 Tax=Penicillium malachiteum TaxID=1324776 RepID=A0AAD6N0N3_9EURO|nr:hypothetical protein N7528_007504 [Penicillium herquei]KAJ5738616.1 hypothetical protein N7493_001771 [Penicillium malachiteum]
MKYTIVFSALFAAAFAMPTTEGNLGKPTCESHQEVVCSGNGNGGLLSLGNILTGLLGESCSGGDVYCCSSEDVQNGLINLNLDLQCSLNHLL